MERPGGKYNMNAEKLLKEKRDAVIRNFEVIGEAAKRIPAAFAKALTVA